MDYYFTYGLLIPLLASILFIIILYSQNKKKKEVVEKLVFENHKLETLRKDEIKNYFKEEWKKGENELDLRLSQKREAIKSESTKLESDFQVNKTELNGLLQQLEIQLQEKEKRYNEVNQDLDLYKQGKMKEIDGTAAEYEQRKRQLVDSSIDKYREMQTTYANNYFNSLKVIKESKENEIKEINAKLEVERSRRAAINEEIRKAEEKEKYNELHSVQLTENEKEDIHFLLSLEDRLHNKQALYKLVWSTYLQQAYKNTFNNILGSRDPRNVIYCIENINTGKKYIGKTSAEVSKRWTEHIKTSLNIGTIKTTNIHKALYNHWDEFIFYILTETEKDKLSEMEKYYISFYESDKYGYNIKAGG